MNKKLILAILSFTLTFLLANLTSAYHYNSGYSANYGWDNLNYQVENRVVHNKVYDYFKYGSYWQHGGNWPVYTRDNYDSNYYFPSQIKINYKNHLHVNDYTTRINVYNSNPPRPIGRMHSEDRTYVINCGYADGFYRDCY